MIMDNKKLSNLYFSDKFLMKENKSFNNNVFSLYIQKINFENDSNSPQKKIKNINYSPKSLMNKKSYSISKSLKYVLSSPTSESIPSSFSSMSLPLKIKKFYLNNQGKVKNLLTEKSRKNKFLDEMEKKDKISLSFKGKQYNNNLSIQNNYNMKKIVSPLGNSNLNNRTQFLKELRDKSNSKTPLITIYQYKNFREDNSFIPKSDKRNLENKFNNKLIRKNINIAISTPLVKYQKDSQFNIKNIDKSYTNSSHSDKLSFEF